MKGGGAGVPEPKDVIAGFKKQLLRTRDVPVVVRSSGVV